MSKSLWGVITGCLLISCPVFVSAVSPSVIRKSTTTNTEAEIAISLEKAKSEIDFCKNNRGRSFDEIDMSKVGDVGAYALGPEVVTDGLIASKYEWYGDLSKAADYYYKDYLVHIGKRPWKSKHSWSSPGDSTPFPIFMYVLKRNQDYERMLKVYPEYFNYCFLGRVKGPKGLKVSKKEEMKWLKNEMKYDTELKSNYDNFMEEWREVKRLVKTEKPKPLDPAVQNHKWFYSDKQEEVSKALEYYSTNKVNFMLEKALNHKDPLIAEKAKKYLKTVPKEGASDETKK